MEMIEMPEHARIWIYTSPNALSAEIQKGIIEDTREFLQSWKAHGTPLTAACEFSHDHFLILAVDEEHAQASGCSIDASVRFVQVLEKKWKVELFNRMTVVFSSDGNKWQAAPLHQFWAMRKAEIVNSTTGVVNTMVKNVIEFRTQWIIPFEKSWHAEMWGR